MGNAAKSRSAARVWRPTPPRVPAAWTRRCEANPPQASLLRSFLLVVLRNAIPLVGFVKFDWPAGDVVLLGAFNLGSIFAAASVRPRAISTLLTATPSRTALRLGAWSAAMVVLTWAIVLVVPPLGWVAADIVASGAVRPWGLVGSAAGISFVAATEFYHELREHADTLRAKAATVAPRGAFAGFLDLLGPLAFGGCAIGLAVMPLMNEETAPMAVFTVTCVSLFIDLLRTFAPAELEQMNLDGAPAARRGSR
ncbi:MAG TPA: hypothetical protein VFB32_05300 [Rudaea sp.]|nr:hypothetical protein [Rudaea sp.]